MPMIFVIVDGEIRVYQEGDILPEGCELIAVYGAGGANRNMKAILFDNSWMSRFETAMAVLAVAPDYIHEHLRKEFAPQVFSVEYTEETMAFFEGL